MSHSPVFDQTMRSLKGTFEENRPSRRNFLRAAAGAAAAPLLSAKRAPVVDVAVVGAGLAGLACAYELKRAGVNATIYEASDDRAGGRCWSFAPNTMFPGQSAERGGELIDNLHKTMIGWAREFGLTLEDVGKQPGEVTWYFGGQHYSDADVVEEFRAFVPAMRRDLRTLSPEPSALAHTDADAALDRVSLAEYLDSRGAGPLARMAIEAAYLAEYGLAPAEQSCLNFLLFIHADRRSKFTPFGVFSDERYHIVEGNDAVVKGLLTRVPPVRYGHTLQAASREADGRVSLTFAGKGVRRHDAVVLAIPFSVLRHADLSGLTLPGPQVNAIETLGYGTNAKMMVGFDRRPWAVAGSSGASYSDLANHQATWETNPTRATPQRAVLTDYSSGARGASLLPANVQTEAGNFLADLERVYPGAQSAATVTATGYRAHIEPWPNNELTRGSYTCYRPGQFTTIAGLEGLPAGNVVFAGEHANSFYEWQGFMEGAALSGIAAAAHILRRK